MSNVLPTPFLGRLLLEAIPDDVESYMKEKAGLSKDSLIVLPENYKEKHSLPVKKGKIISMAIDAFGDAFTNRYGNVGYTPNIGDIVYYIPGQSYRIDVDEKYHLIADEDIMAVESATESGE